MTVLSRLSAVRTMRTLKSPQFWRRVFQRIPPLWFGSLGIGPMQSTDPFGGLSTQLDSIFTSLIQIAKNIAPAVGILGFIGLGILYMGSSWPIISTWKQQNPQAVGNVMMGLFFVLFASLIVSIIPNPGGFS